jgi:hypothetical protein
VKGGGRQRELDPARNCFAPLYAFERHEYELVLKLALPAAMDSNAQTMVALQCEGGLGGGSTMRKNATKGRRNSVCGLPSHTHALRINERLLGPADSIHGSGNATNRHVKLHGSTSAFRSAKSAKDHRAAKGLPRTAV